METTPEEMAEFDAMLAAKAARRRYRILRNHRGAGQTTESVLATGLTWDEAERHREDLNAAERASNPQLSCWTRDVFVIEMEQ
jgi:hypothetical protein